MGPNILKDYVVIVITILIAMILAILPLPHWALWARPDWILITLLFWIMVIPQRVNIGIVWCVGLFSDLLTGTLLGQHALVYSLIAYLVIRFIPQLRNFPLWQQTLLIATLVMLSLALQLWIRSLAGSSPGSWAYWLSAFTSAIIWPWIYLLLRECRLRFGLTN